MTRGIASGPDGHENNGIMQIEEERLPSPMSITAYNTIMDSA